MEALKLVAEEEKRKHAALKAQLKEAARAVPKTGGKRQRAAPKEKPVADGPRQTKATPPLGELAGPEVAVAKATSIKTMFAKKL